MRNTSEAKQNLRAYLDGVAWEPYKTVKLSPENTVEKVKKGHRERDDVQLRALHDFTIMKGDELATVTPDTPASELASLKVYARMASLNGPAYYMIMAGEWEVEWDMYDSVSVYVTGITEVCLETSNRFRDGIPWTCVKTKGFCFFMLEPSEAMQRLWNRCVDSEWPKPAKGTMIRYQSLDFTKGRPGYWHGRQSWLKTVEWVVADSEGKIQPPEDEPRPDDISDDLPSDDEDDIPASTQRSNTQKPNASGSSRSTRRSNRTEQLNLARGKQRAAVSEDEEEPEQERERPVRSKRAKGKRNLATAVEASQPLGDPPTDQNRRQIARKTNTTKRRKTGENVNSAGRVSGRKPEPEAPAADHGAQDEDVGEETSGPDPAVNAALTRPLSTTASIATPPTLSIDAPVGTSVLSSVRSTLANANDGRLEQEPESQSQQQSGLQFSFQSGPTSRPGPSSLPDPSSLPGPSSQLGTSPSFRPSPWSQEGTLDARPSENTPISKVNLQPAPTHAAESVASAEMQGLQVHVQGEAYMPNCPACPPFLVPSAPSLPSTSTLPYGDPQQHAGLARVDVQAYTQLLPLPGAPAGPSFYQTQPYAGGLDSAYSSQPATEFDGNGSFVDEIGQHSSLSNMSEVDDFLGLSAMIDAMDTETSGELIEDSMNFPWMNDVWGRADVNNPPDPLSVQEGVN
ncbi:hypothetical protein FRC07_002272 [Ceratobasidium sp. 392]|nr:hypothetical protein FRC07_002272 [Ceratobasidium sp. 392]